MKELIKKYVIIAIVALILVEILTAIILALNPDLLITQSPDGATHTLGTVFLSKGIQLVLNLFIVFVIFIDMKKSNKISIPVLFLTFISNLAGIIIFLMMSAYNELRINKVKL